MHELLEMVRTAVRNEFPCRVHKVHPGVRKLLAYACQDGLRMESVSDATARTDEGGADVGGDPGHEVTFGRDGQRSEGVCQGENEASVNGLRFWLELSCVPWTEGREHTPTRLA